MTEESVEVTEELEETVENTEEQDIRAAFDEAIDAGQADEDDIKISMISAGATFKNVTRFYNKFMENAGMALSKDAKTDLAKVAVEENDVTEEEGFDAAVNYVVENSDGKIKERSAGGLVRAAAKKVDVEYFKKPKAAGKPRSTFMDDMYDMMFNNPYTTESELEAYVKANGNKTNISILGFHQRTRAMVNRIAKTHNL